MAGKQNGRQMQLENVKLICEKYQEGWSYAKIKTLFDFPFSITMIGNILKQNNVHIRTNREQALKYSCNEDFFEIIDTEQKAYWLGFMYADGYIMNKRKHCDYKIGIALKDIDCEILEKFKEDIKYTGDIKYYFRKPNKLTSVTTRYGRLLISSNKLAKDLINKGCMIQKTDILKFPTKKQVPKYLINHFIRGYFDGDGTITNLSKNGEYASPTLGFCGTINILKGIQSFFGFEHVKLSKRHLNNTDNYQLVIGGRRQVVEILKILYADSTRFLKRKKDKIDGVIEFDKNYNPIGRWHREEY